MGKLITADDVEITFEKQDDSHSCKWCIYVRVRKKDKEKNVLMIRTNKLPFTRYMLNSKNIVRNSKNSFNEIMLNIVDFKEFKDSKKN